MLKTPSTVPLTPFLARKGEALRLPAPMESGHTPFFIGLLAGRGDRCDAFDVVRLGEHVDRLEPFDAEPPLHQHSQVSRQRVRVAGYVDGPFRRNPHHRLKRRGVAPDPRRVQHHGV